jgi:hypothetical protein
MHQYCAAQDPVIAFVGADQVGAAQYLARYFEMCVTKMVFF